MAFTLPLGFTLGVMVLCSPGCHQPDGIQLVRPAALAPRSSPLPAGPDVATAVWVAPKPESVVPSATALERRLELAGARAGDIQVSLGWNSRDDLDLRVRPPCGGEIYYGSRVACGGRLDVDMNVGRTGLRDEAAENIYFAAGAARTGRYEVRVTHAGDNSGLRQVHFVVRVVVAGVARLHSGAVARGEAAPVTAFAWP